MAEHKGLKDICDLTPQVWFAFLDARLEAVIKPVSVNSDLSELRHFVSFLRGLERAVCERFLLVEPLKAGWRMPKDVPVEQLRKLQATIQAQANSPHAGHRRIGRLDQAWFLLMLHCGLRTCEVRHLKLQRHRVGCEAPAHRAIQGAQRPLYLPGRRRFERITVISGGAWTNQCPARKRVRFPPCATMPHLLLQEIGDIRIALWG